ncbi:hypothetical protein D3C80_895000 [compost metagenome]
MLAHTGIEFEGEGRLVEAVETLQVGIERANVQGYRCLLAAIFQVYQVVAQLHVLEQHLPGFAWRFDRFLFRRRCCGSRLGLFLRRGLGGLAGKQLLPVELAIFFQRRPGFELFAANLAHGDLLLDQINGGFANLQAGQACQRSAIRRLDGEWRDAHGDVIQQQLGLFGEVELVMRIEAYHAVFQHQWHGIAHVGPEQLHLAVSDLQCAFGGDRRQAQGALPVDASAIGAAGHQGHVGIVVGQGAEVFQLQIHVVVEELDRLAGPQVLEVQVAVDEFDAANTQRERVAGRLFGFGFAGR